MLEVIVFGICLLLTTITFGSFICKIVTDVSNRRHTDLSFEILFTIITIVCWCWFYWLTH